MPSAPTPTESAAPLRVRFTSPGYQSAPHGDNAMTSRPAAPAWLVPLTDYGPLVVFFAVYMASDLMAATAALMAATVAALALGYAIARRVPTMALVAAALVGAFGGLTLVFDDETFIKMKPTAVQLLFAAVLAGGLALGRSPLRVVLGRALDLDAEGWRRLTLRYAVFFVAMAGLNELVWRTQPTDTWVTFKVFGLAGLTVLFTLAQMPLIHRHQKPDAAEGR